MASNLLGIRGLGADKCVCPDALECFGAIPCECIDSITLAADANGIVCVTGVTLSAVGAGIAQYDAADEETLFYNQIKAQSGSNIEHNMFGVFEGVSKLRDKEFEDLCASCSLIFFQKWCNGAVTATIDYKETSPGVFEWLPPKKAGRTGEIQRLSGSKGDNENNARYEANFTATTKKWARFVTLAWEDLPLLQTTP